MKGRSVLVLLIMSAVVIFGAALGAGCCTTQPEPPTQEAEGPKETVSPLAEQEKPKAVVSPFAQVVPEIPQMPMSLEDLTFDWFAFPVTAGGGTFTPIFLPFTYTGEVEEPDPNQTYTFPHLLSFKMDWVPNNACTRHPFFVFKRDRDLLPELKDAPLETVTEFVASWSGTHGIGGELHETAEGWSGAMAVYDVANQTVTDYEYEEPREYFRLMADMTLDMFALMEQPFSAELKAEIEKDLTESKEALRLLGEAAAADERSSKEWASYKKILALDPDFAEVRYWYANQNGWHMGGQEAAWRGRAKALSSRIVKAALREYPGDPVTDEATWKAYSDAVNKATALSPTDPFLLLAGVRLELRSKSLSKVSLEDLKELELVCKKYPGCGPLLKEVARSYYWHAYPEKVIPIALSEVRSGFLGGSRGHSITWFLAGSAFGHLTGDWHRALFCNVAGVREGPEASFRPSFLREVAISLHELCAFEMAARAYEAAYEDAPDISTLVDWITCLYEGGFYEKALQLQERYKAEIKNDPMSYLIKAAQLIYSGEHEKGLSLLMEEGRSADYNQRCWHLYYALRWEAQYMSNDPDARRSFERTLLWRPGYRRGWALLDLWERRQRTDASHYLYETYLWLHPDDEWFMKAYAEFRKTDSGPSPEVDVQGMLDILAAAKSVGPKNAITHLQKAGVKPLMIEWTIKKLLDAKDHENAERVSQLYYDLGQGIGGWEFRGWRRWICSLAARAKAKASEQEVE